MVFGTKATSNILSCCAVISLIFPDLEQGSHCSKSKTHAEIYSLYKNVPYMTQEAVKSNIKILFPCVKNNNLLISQDEIFEKSFKSHVTS